MQLIWCLLSNFYLNMFRASLCPSSGEQECALPHNQCRTQYAAVHTLVLLMMGIMMPETCWDRSLLINIRLVVSCWFLSLHTTTFCGSRLKPKIISSKLYSLWRALLTAYSSALLTLCRICLSWYFGWRCCLIFRDIEFGPVGFWSDCEGWKVGG
jgi:hypothetical protein